MDRMQLGMAMKNSSSKESEEDVLSLNSVDVFEWSLTHSQMMSCHNIKGSNTPGRHNVEEMENGEASAARGTEVWSLPQRLQRCQQSFVFIMSCSKRY